MLIQFTVENFLSIKEKIFLSLEPSSDSEHPENLNEKNGKKAMNTAAIYGANASGKSNLFKAVATAVNMIRNSNSLPVNARLPVIPFKFDEECLNEPTSFEFTFIAGDGKKYIYGFSALPDRITEEYLYCYKSAKPSLLFERNPDKDQEYKFPRASRIKMEAAAQMNTPNKLFLTTATSWNVEETKPAFEWFSESINTVGEVKQVMEMALDSYRTDEDHSVIRFTEELLKEADINISRMSVRSEKKEAGLPSDEGIKAGILTGLPDLNDHYDVRIDTEHTVSRPDGTKKSIRLTLGEESLGTQQLVFYGPFLKDTFEKGKVLMIDEIGRSLHPFIVKHIINLFRNPRINPNGAQLIVTTHETTLLSLDTFRRDQIYFTEKDGATGVTDLYSLDEFSVRKVENIQKGYLLGRYGAIPFLRAEEVF